MKSTGSPTPTSPFCITLGPFIIEAVIPTIAVAFRYHTLVLQDIPSKFRQNPASIPTPYIKSRRTAIENRGKKLLLYRARLCSRRKEKKREERGSLTEKSSGNGRGRDPHASLLTRQAHSRPYRVRTGHCTRANMRQARGHYPLCWEHG
jgi:hypothetical protein